MKKTGETALQTALQGGNVKDGQAKAALNVATDMIKNLEKKATNVASKAAHYKEQAFETGEAAIHVGEAAVASFLGGLAEGMYGTEKMKKGPIDIRAGLGVVSVGYGLYRCFTKGGGGHAIAIGTGLLDSAITSLGQEVGQSFAAKRAAQSGAAGGGGAAANNPPSLQQGMSAPAVTLTAPAAQPEMAGREVTMRHAQDELTRLHARGRRNSRFPRAA